MEAWSLLKLNPQSQSRFVDYAHEWCPDVELYYPKYERMSRPHGSRKAMRVLSPVYPGYVFARVDNRYVGGLTRLPVRAWWVKFGGIVETVPGSVISTIRRYEQRNELVREEKHVNPYSPGVRVRVHMPVGDLFGVISRIYSVQCVQVSLPVGRAIVPVTALNIV
jgi:hypothetical protein